MSETKQISPFEEFKNNVNRFKPEFQKSLGQNIDVDKFIKVAINAITDNPKLLELNRMSLFSSLQKCAQDGLMPDGREAALVAFKSDVKYMPMVSGYLKRARNSGEIGTMDAQVVYEKDEFEEWTDETGPHFKHRKSRGDRGKREGVYAYAVTKDGFLYFEYMTSNEIESIQKTSRSQHLWRGDFADEMWKKTAIRRLCKYRLPSSSDMINMLAKDTEENYAEPISIENEPEEKQDSKSRLESIIESESEDGKKEAPF